MTRPLLPDDHDELLRRIERDLLDGYDEELSRIFQRWRAVRVQAPF